MNYIDNSVKIVWINFMLFLITCPVIGQVRETKQLTPADYNLWSTLNAEAISDQGKWVSYSLSYESGLDTLFVKSTETEQTVAFAKGFDGKFIGDAWFVCMLPENRFQLQNLLTGKVQKVDQVQRFVLVNEGQYIILFCNTNEGKTKIVIKNLNGDTIETIVNVTSYSMSPQSDQLAYCTSDSIGAGVGLLQFGKKIVKTSVINSNTKLFENVVWQSEGTSIVFVGRSMDAEAFTADTVLHYRIGNKQLFQYDTVMEKSWPKEMMLDANFTSSLGISDDGARVFFKFKKIPEVSGIKNNSGVQIWNAADKDLYPIWNRYGKPENDPRLAAWWPESGKFMAVGDAMHPAAILNGNQKFALVYNQDHNKPTFKQVADIDYYLVDLNTGLKSPFLKKQSGVLDQLIMSPGGKNIVYFRDRNWWVYSFATNTHTNITRNTGVSFYDDFTYPGEPSAYGLMGWTANDESLLLYDQFDIWEFSLDNKVIGKKLTQGRESQQIFRLAKTQYWDPYAVTSKAQIVNLNSSLLLKVKAIDHSKSGYVGIDKNLKAQSIVFEPKWVSSILKAKKKNCFIYLQEDYNEPPAILLKKDNKSPKIIYKSNPQHDNYGWGDSKLIDYKNSKGISVKGALFYPFNYNPRQQYPMVVHIYERKSGNINRYANPSLLNQGNGFNISNYTSQGYFVLLPDIIYEVGNPGFSAADCVIAATKSALEIAPVNKNRLGLIGGSFGGYETDFIITQTNMFAAAVAGSGISDFSSNYLSVCWGDKKSNNWRFEHGQMRMEKTWFEDMDGYLKNSPINAVSKVKTPLLSYTGEEDTQVNPYQTMEFYLALRRLKKEHIMLIFPKEGHAFLGHETQSDLTNRVSDWFGYYLKGEKKPGWFEPR
ncbi:MAG: alpha/beta hydrolase family protein [Lutibacter sp.]